jgi:hypothetical protein
MNMHIRMHRRMHPHRHVHHHHHHHHVPRNPTAPCHPTRPTQPATTNPPQAESDEQGAVRLQRDKAFRKALKLAQPVTNGGQNLTFAKMDASIKVDMTNAMGLLPAKWPPHVTIARAESKVASDRCNGKKRVGVSGGV